MKAKILPIMIGSILAGGMTAAQADVTVFGHLDQSVVNWDADAGFINTAKMPGSWPSNVNEYDSSDTNLHCTTCSIGFKGSEDLGNGLKAIFKLDFQFDMNNRNDGDAITDRDQWLGLAGNFGQVRVGTISTSYKSHGAMIDPLYRTVGQGRDWGFQSFLHSNAGEEGQGRADNTIRYDSPDWNGLKVTAHYTLDSHEGEDCFTEGVGYTSCEDDDPYGVGVQYSNGGLLVFADYLTNDTSANVAGVPPTGNESGDLSAWKVGGKYTLNNFAVYAQYEDISDDFGGGIELDAEQYFVGASYTMGNNMLYAAYGTLTTDDLASSTSVVAGTPVGLPLAGNSSMDQTSWSIAAAHSFSKQTMVYAAYINVEQDNDNGLNDYLTNTDPNTSAYGDTTNDPEMSVFAVGLQHKF